MLRDGAKKRASSARTDRGKILNLIAGSQGLSLTECAPGRREHILPQPLKKEEADPAGIH
jgi:hypothetical protein